MNLKLLFKKPLQKEQLPKWVVIVFLAIALIGFADATYLVVEHYINAIPPCTTDGCETVLTSPYAILLGLPVALWGSLYYLCILVLAIIYLDVKKEFFLRGAFFFTTIGFLMSIYFFILQATVIHAFCQYCLVSASTSTILFIISTISLVKYRKDGQKENMTCPIS